MDALLRRFTETGPAGCAAMVSRGGELLYEGYTGVADVGTQKPICADTLYRMYSMTKVVTCTAALLLLERGLYRLDDPLEEYLPEFAAPQVYRLSEAGEAYAAPANGPIRIRHLFTMTSGLSYGNDSCETARRTLEVMDRYGAGGLRAFSKELAKIPLAFDPGAHWLYGLSHDILGALIEVLSEKSFGEFLEQEIFDPLGMTDTSFRTTEATEPRLCGLYTRGQDGSFVPHAWLEDFFHPGAQCESGGAGLLSTMRDYMRFTQAMACDRPAGSRPIGRKTMELMATNFLNPVQLADFNWPTVTGYGYGLGVRVMMDPAVSGAPGTPGEFAWSGYAGTWMLIDPREELAAVYVQQMPGISERIQPRLRAAIYGML